MNMVAKLILHVREMCKFKFYFIYYFVKYIEIITTILTLTSLIGTFNSKKKNDSLLDYLFKIDNNV